ncbi:MAG TPA: hypothetical protein PLU33_13100, partial [Treponemataceae bacterium]|nr:hypothetical protein [Treponemataceae bacterium]
SMGHFPLRFFRTISLSFHSNWRTIPIFVDKAENLRTKKNRDIRYHTDDDFLPLYGPEAENS